MLTLHNRIGYQRSLTAASLAFVTLLFVSAYVALIRKELYFEDTSFNQERNIASKLQAMFPDNRENWKILMTWFLKNVFGIETLKSLALGYMFCILQGLRRLVSVDDLRCCVQNILKWTLKENFQAFACQNQCRPPGSESLPKGIVVNTSNLERRPLWGSPEKFNSTRSLFTLAVGIKQKDTVDHMVQKFLERDFVVMLFHYDGAVDGWKDLEWTDSVVHVSALNQTKWWFAKRFLHPDIVADYDYVFLWDEDIGVQHFSPERYLSIVKQYGLEISQPALDPSESEVHHQITVRGRSVVHRRMYKKDANGHGCDDKSSGPPCSGWIELMAPVFSRAAWRCVWYMIQNDLIHAWGLDMHLGYCAQGDRTENIGVVDAEYIVHYGLPTLGVPKNKTDTDEELNLGNIKTNGSSNSTKPKDVRVEVRRQSFREYKVFRKRWSKAVNEDQCWTDPFSEPIKEITLQKEKE